MKESEVKKIKTIFNSWAQSSRSDTMAEGHQIGVSYMLSLINSDEPFTFLDVGCGNGWVVSNITKLKNCKAAYGIYLAEDMIVLAKSRIQNKKENYIHTNFL